MITTSTNRLGAKRSSLKKKISLENSTSISTLIIMRKKNPQHRVKDISGDIDAYQEEMNSLRYNLHRNNYPESVYNIGSKKSGEDDRERYVKTHHSISALCQRPSRKKSKRYIVHMTSGQYSQMAHLSGGISSVSSPQQNSTWQRTVCTPSFAVVVKYTKARYTAH